MQSLLPDLQVNTQVISAAKAWGIQHSGYLLCSESTWHALCVSNLRLVNNWPVSIPLAYPLPCKTLKRKRNMRRGWSCSERFHLDTVAIGTTALISLFSISILQALLTESEAELALKWFNCTCRQNQAMFGIFFRKRGWVLLGTSLPGGKAKPGLALSTLKLSSLLWLLIAGTEYACGGRYRRMNACDKTRNKTGEWRNGWSNCNS